MPKPLDRGEAPGVELPRLDEFERARCSRHVPVVLSPQEARRVLAHLTGTHRLMASLLYGAGLRLLGCCTLRVKDLERLAADMAEVAGEYTKLLRVIMFHTFDDGKDESWSYNFEPHAVTTLIRSDGAAERSLTIRNPACKYPPSAETLKKVDTAFTMN